ncbi:MAG TPA: hypothetical protein VGR41_08595 [Actinomycetota bacterium]|nr:hypothetical protein [Actinomycetota bacterium]
MTARGNVVATVLALSLLAGACTGNGNPDPTTTSGADASQLGASMASSDLYAGSPQRVLVGVLQQDQDGVHNVTGGSVRFVFSYLGASGTDPAVEGPTASANYVPAPGLPGSPAGTPTPTDPSVSRGTYQAEGVTFDQAGLWEVAVSADIAGFGQQTLTTQFQVTDEPLLLAPGDQAFATKNLNVHSKGAEPVSIDSRALDGSPIPDRVLHEWTVADAMREHRPVLLLVATPTYCTSQFCGPDTDAVAQLAQTFGDRAVFIHIEVYKDFNAAADADKFNEAALQWLEPVGTEPWMWLIGADGTIVDRWGPVWDPNEVAQELAKLPKMK